MLSSMQMPFSFFIAVCFSEYFGKLVSLQLEKADCIFGLSDESDFKRFQTRSMPPDPYH